MRLLDDEPRGRERDGDTHDHRPQGAEAHDGRRGGGDRGDNLSAELEVGPELRIVASVSVQSHVGRKLLEVELGDVDRDVLEELADAAEKTPAPRVMVFALERLELLL